MPDMVSNKTLRIGGELEVNRLGYGAMQLVGLPWAYGPPPAEVDPTAILRRAVDLGVNFIDTADLYGPNLNEQQIAEALYPYPPELVIATKGGLTRPDGQEDQYIPVSTPEHLRKALEGSLRRLKRDCIDLYQLHQASPDVPIEDIMGTLVKLREEGKLRHIGLSNVNVEQIQRATTVTPIATVQNMFNLITRRSDDVLAYCEANGITFVPWYPLAAGDLTGPGSALGVLAAKFAATPAQISLAWLLQKSPATLLIPGTRSIKHLESNMASHNIELPAADMAILDGFAATQEKRHWMEEKLDEQQAGLTKC